MEPLWLGVFVFSVDLPADEGQITLVRGTFGGTADMCSFVASMSGAADAFIAIH